MLFGKWYINTIECRVIKCIQKNRIEIYFPVLCLIKWWLIVKETKLTLIVHKGQEVRSTPKLRGAREISLRHELFFLGFLFLEKTKKSKCIIVNYFHSPSTIQFCHDSLAYKKTNINKGHIVTFVSMYILTSHLDQFNYRYFLNNSALQ
jgi:hypothetical protein